MLKRIALLCMIVLSYNLHADIETIYHDNDTEQSTIINNVYSIGSSAKLTVLLVVNLNVNHREKLDWMFENISNRTPDFQYCGHGYGFRCICRHTSEKIQYATLNCYKPLTDICGSAGAPAILIFKNGKIIHTISSDILLSNTLSPYEIEQICRQTLDSRYAKALTQKEKDEAKKASSYPFF